MNERMQRSRKTLKELRGMLFSKCIFLCESGNFVTWIGKLIAEPNTYIFIRHNVYLLNESPSWIGMRKEEIEAIVQNASEILGENDE